MGQRSRDHRPCPPGTARRLILAACAAFALFAFAASTASADPIEGVWSFNGGRVAIKADGDGTLSGIVVSPTKFDECVHEVGEEVWSQITPQVDGSYQGLHRWFTTDGNCDPVSTLGHTAWRVISDSHGSRFLRVCFSSPGSTAQPQIDNDGEHADTTYGCVDSQRIAGLPQSTFRSYTRLPPNTACIRRPRLRIHIHDRANDPLKQVRVTLHSHGVRRAAKIKRRRKGILATLNLRRLANGPFTVTVRLTTVLDEHFFGRRTYSLCRPTKHRS